jgi:VIT1/CCC1 family predicted Fe2+/Mn2+ transporter
LAFKNYKSQSGVMKTIYHREEHFQGGNTIRDIVIGMSDGLTVPFALAAGISGAIAETHLVVTAGFAKGYFTGVSLFKSGFQMVFVGGMAAGAAYLLAKAIS